MKLHPSLTEARIVRAIDAGGMGFCALCGQWAPFYVEPNAKQVTFGWWRASDHQHSVYGANQLLRMIVDR